MKQSLLLVAFLGHGRVRGDFHTSFSSTIKCLKSTVSEENEEEQTRTFGTQASRDNRQAGRQACTHTQAKGALTATHTLVSLLCSQP